MVKYIVSFLLGSVMTIFLFGVILLLVKFESNEGVILCEYPAPATYLSDECKCWFTSSEDKQEKITELGVGCNIFGLNIADKIGLPKCI